MKADNRGTVSFFDKSVLPWLICSIGMLFYCYNYFLRVSPSVMKNDLMQGLHITASQFGILAALYYWAYTPMQIPIGMIYDRFGARIVLFFACLIAVLGLSVFIGANSYGMACLGRFMIGFGVAFSYIGVLKLASLWLPPNRFATVAGLTTAFGMASAIFSVIFLTKFVQLMGYKNALYTTLITGVVLSVFIILFMRNKPKIPLATTSKVVRAPLSFRELLHSLRIVLLKPQMWLIGIIGCLFYLPASVFLDLWAVSYLQTVYGVTPEVASYVVSMTFVGWIIAGPSIGMLSDHFKRRRLPLLICATMAAVMLAIVFYVPNISISYLYVLFFFIGIFCGAHPLCFALGKENNPNSISGTAVAVTNTLIMLGGLIFQPVVGLLLDYHTGTNGVTGAIPVYTPADYTYALSVVPIGLMLAIVLTFFLKETYCESQEDTAEKLKPRKIYGLQAETGN
jgi:MFS family permease